ncbi:MAG: hypothetical protein B7Y56_05180 [Gallionellales bacterium 35-53-114]|jgi:EAL domain-containing protein (putative c-di-GMP-specific phosphodiesterase class I)|nr:MAG: hypothetical protein B7Y56_05180 [Gallionellales bacterium 35-53-114]OYZ65477.1 MAG: hypothetical protein B7Y04_02335 [Gallionellales bacterium 24-53-125]OZB08383.1 MAG: hypothetical protein B7X61_12790 [Gallionellales bacterium 39-52-133]HQS58327.1 EAL domain-containing response regulator [Gallionellaceae bacterium]HQS73882.1 EAL domain-containing response regulator [Gallionellaceae bacterium]
MNQNSINILALDDDPFMLKLLVRILKNIGHNKVSTCDSGQAALELINNMDLRPDLILLDINMPRMDGLEFVRHLVEWCYSGSIILISGEDERTRQAAEKLARAHKITVLGHLHKPVKPEALAELIKKWEPAKNCIPRAELKIYSADEVRAAITNGELINHYQPKVATDTGQVKGVETLVRWNHPHDGMVFPDQFIGVAEAHGLIGDLTLMVLTDALSQVKLWQDEGLTLHVAVNLSMDSLVSLDFADLIAGVLEKSGVAPQILELEVTETRLMDDLRIPLEALSRLRLKRIRLSIDDFGIGNSTLAQLRDLPFDELKIDQSFVHGACKNKKLEAMFNSCLSLAKQLKMSVVAEGVEDQADFDFVCKTGCDIAQGYFIAKPMPGADIPAWIRSWKNFYRVSNRRV